VSCTNLKNGLGLSAPLAVSLLMMANKAIAGYVEEIIFRGFLFRSMAKDNLRSAIIVSAVTFGAGHIVNVLNTANILGVLLQVCYAIAIGFMYTLIVYKGGSLWPCIVSHMFVNGSSVFGQEQGPFTDLIASVFGQATPDLIQIVIALLIILTSGGYALWLWKKAE
jgi:membrane protease YdiL (CAAX protease family)